jgi:arylsulfatase A-like enzyme
MRWPGHIPAGKRYGDQVRLIDILPTVLDLVHAPLTDELMGQTLAPLFSGGKLARNEPAVSELFTMGQTLRSFRRPDRKLIFDVRTHRGAVFDLMTDPGEQSQVITRDSPLVEKALADRQWALAWLERYRKAMPETKRTEEIPDELLQQLEALGYLEDPRETARTQPVDTSGEP